MKRHLDITKLAMVAALVAFISCQKENADPDPEPVPEPSTTFVCEHNSIEYVEAVRRTGKTTGNLAHWHCNDCNRNFLDAGATKEIVNAYFPATNYSIDSEILNRIQNIYPFVPASEQTKSNDKGLIPSAVTFFHHKIEAYKFKEYSIAVFKELQEIQGQLNVIESQVVAIQKQNTEILEKMEDSAYADAVAEMFNKGRFIWETSLTYFDYYVKYYGQYVEEKISIDELQDLTKRLCLQWNSNEYGSESIYNLTTRVIEQFSGYVIERENMTYPQIFHKYNSDYRLWDHEGYTDRKQMDVEAEAVLSLGYFMACLYRDNAKFYWLPEDRETDSMKLNGYYKQIEPLIETDLENMQKAYDKYRYFHDGNKNKIFIDKSAVIVNSDVAVNDLEKNHIKYNFNNSDEVGSAINQINSIWNKYSDFGWENGTTLTVEDYTTIRNSYSNGNIFNILYNTAKIVGMPEKFHKTQSVGGTDRTLIIRYSSSKQSDYHDYATCDCGVWGYKNDRYASETWWHEYNIWIYYCGHSPNPDSIWLNTKEMSETCVQMDDWRHLLTAHKNLTDHLKSHYKVELGGKGTYWTPNEYAQVFLKKYTGPVLDE